MVGTLCGHFPDVVQSRLPMILSDHFPLLLDCGELLRGRRYFKFDNMWLKTKGFVEKVRGTGGVFSVSRVVLVFFLAQKLKDLNANLKCGMKQSLLLWRWEKKRLFLMI